MRKIVMASALLRRGQSAFGWSQKLPSLLLAVFADGLRLCRRPDVDSWLIAPDYAPAMVAARWTRVEALALFRLQMRLARPAMEVKAMFDEHTCALTARHAEVFAPKGKFLVI